MKFGCVVVTYFPSERTLKNVELLNLSKHIEHIVIVDNTADSNVIVNKLYMFDKVRIIKNNKNMGIAYAQNQGISFLHNTGLNWVYTFDQDSIIFPNFFEVIDKYSELMNYDDTAIIAMNYLDNRIKKPAFNIDNVIRVEEVISSGSLINLNIFYHIGGMKEYYFMDQVDNEYCYRLNKYGYIIYVLPDLCMEHELGNIKEKKMFNRYFYTYNQNPIRYYYRTRNTIYFYKEYAEIKKEKQKQLIFDFLRILFEKNRMKKWYYFFKGYFDGFKWKKINKKNDVIR